MEYANAILEVTRQIGEPAFELLVRGRYASALVGAIGGGLLGFLLLPLGLFSLYKGFDEEMETLAALGAIVSFVGFIALITAIGSLPCLVEPEGATAVWLLNSVTR